MTAKQLLTVRDIENLGGDREQKPWRSITNLDPDVVYIIQEIRRLPKNSVIDNDQIVLEMEKFQTALPQRYVEPLMCNEYNFELFKQKTQFLIYRGLRKTKANLKFAVINTSLPTFPNGCVCAVNCEKCSCADKPNEPSCFCWMDKKFENFDNYIEKIKEINHDKIDSLKSKKRTKNFELDDNEEHPQKKNNFYYCFPNDTPYY